MIVKRSYQLAEIVKEQAELLHHEIFHKENNNELGNNYYAGFQYDKLMGYIEMNSARYGSFGKQKIPCINIFTGITYSPQIINNKIPELDMNFCNDQYISFMGILPKFRNCGIGTELLNKTIEYLNFEDSHSTRCLWAIVDEKHPSDSFWLKNNFNLRGAYEIPDVQTGRIIASNQRVYVRHIN